MYFTCGPGGPCGPIKLAVVVATVVVVGSGGTIIFGLHSVSLVYEAISEVIQNKRVIVIEHVM
jgi:phosphotransferase system IIB component